MEQSIDQKKTYELLGYFANYAAELLEDKKKLTEQLEAIQELLLELVKELGPAALVHPNPVVRELAKRFEDVQKENDPI